jgi:hypothetical protein
MKSRLVAGLVASGVMLALCTRCAAPGRRVIVVFPSEGLMQVTSSVELAVYQLSGTDDACATLGLGRSPGDRAKQVQLQTQRFPFAHDAVSLADLEDGRYAFVASAKNTSGEQFLSGCTAADLHPGDTEPIRVELAELRWCCDGADTRCINTTTVSCYDGPLATRDKGACHAGTATCKDGYFTTCDGQVLPRAETCNAIDDDCDGVIDDVEFDLLTSDRNNCGQCGRVCAGSCINGTCRPAADGGSLDAGQGDGPIDDTVDLGIDGNVLDGPAAPDAAAPDTRRTP